MTVLLQQVQRRGASAGADFDVIPRRHLNGVSNLYCCNIDVVEVASHGHKTHADKENEEPLDQ